LDDWSDTLSGNLDCGGKTTKFILLRISEVISIPGGIFHGSGIISKRNEYWPWHHELGVDFAKW
jgi:hypothetical protein